MITSPLFAVGLLFMGSVALSLALVPLARTLARRWSLVDRPDHRRKTHCRPIPVSGGVAIFVTASAVLLVAWLCPGPLSDPLGHWSVRLLRLFLGAATICLLGVLDDLRPLRGRHKLLGQVIAVLLVLPLESPVSAVQLFGVRLELGWVAVPFALFFLLGAINSLNLLDGMDGLLSSVGSVIALALVALAALRSDWAPACVAAVLLGAVLGFLRYNYPPASIFLGDAGSMLLGLVLGVLSLRGTWELSGTVPLAVPLALFTLPIIDTLAAILRRKLTGRSIYCSDRGHLHHCLLRLGLSRPRVLLIVTALGLLGAAGAVAGAALHSDMVPLAAAAAVAAVLIAARLFGHAEAMLVLRRVESLARSLTGFTAARGHQVEVRLQGSADWTKLWAQLTARALDLNFRHVRLDVNAPAVHEGYHATWEGRARRQNAEQDDGWSAEIPLNVRGQAVGRLDVSGWRDGEPVWIKVSAMTAVAEQIEAQLEQLVLGLEAPVVRARDERVAEERLDVSVAAAE